MKKLKLDKVKLKFHNKLGEIAIFRIITVLSVYFTCFPPLKDLDDILKCLISVAN